MHTPVPWSGEVHVAPQPPQLLASEVRSTHAPPQLVSLLAQTLFGASARTHSFESGSQT
jgi:hypothetical protein